MHRLLVTTLALSALLWSSNAIAKPVVLDVQGALRTVAGGPVADGDYAMEVAIWDAATGGKNVWSQTFLAVTVKRGGFALRLGEGKAKDVLDSKVFDGSPRWLSVQIGVEAPLPRRPLAVVPYAVHAESAKTADSAKTAETAKAAKAADSAKTAETAKAADSAKTAETAKKADSAAQAAKALNADNANTAQTALVAKDLACTGCLKATMADQKFITDLGLVTSKQLAKVATTGKYADLDGGPDLKPYGKVDAAQTWQKTQRFAAGIILSAAQPPAACEAKTIGLLYYDTTKQLLRICNGKDYAKVAVVGTVGTKNNPAKDCKAVLKDNGSAKSGLYWIKPGSETFQAWCDMDTDGGGWTLIESYDIGLRTSYNKKPFFKIDFPRKQDSHNWDDYRLSKDRFLALAAVSTRFHARCDRDLQKSPNDYLYADIVLLTKDHGAYQTNSAGANPHNLVAKVRGYSSTKYNFRWWNSEGGANWHPGFDVSGLLPGSKSSEDSFTWHDGGLHPDHRCHTTAGDIVWMVR